MPSYVGDKVRFLVPGREIIDMLEGATADKAQGKSVKLPVKNNVHKNRVRANQWRYVDYDGDGCANW